MNVIITDHSYEDINQEKEIIKNFGAKLAVYACKTEEDVIKCTTEADIIICQFAPITKKVIDNLKECKAIIRYAVGVDNIDVDAATKKGIHVCNVPDYGTEEVALHTVSLILSLIRKLPIQQKASRQGKWTYKETKPIHRLRGQTLGLVGFGRIPRYVAKLMKEFEVQILIHDPFIDNNEIKMLGYNSGSLTELFEKSNIISIHVPLSKQTHHLIDKNLFNITQKNPYIVNTSRGGIINEKDLLEAFLENKISGIALDVSETEPMGIDNPLLKYDQIIVTPHSAWYSEESIEALQRSVAEEAIRILSGDAPKNSVNKFKL